MTYSLTENFTWKTLKQGVVVLNLTDGSYSTLNEVASFIFTNAIGGNGPEEIARKLENEYDCDYSEAYEDVVAYLTQCVADGVLVAGD